MRSEKEMMNLIMKKAFEDERIRAVAMDGSRANKNAVHDRYSDYDIVYFVMDIREFTRDKTWINCFGDILIVQYAEDWYAHPYDYNGHEKFAFLIQFADGNRIDLQVVDIRNINKEAENKEPRIILQNKDDYSELNNVEDEQAFFITKPTEKEFYNICNEFRWLSIYVSKGLCREEFYYARYMYEVHVMDMLVRMLNWKVAADNGFQVTTGSHGKYLKRYLSEGEMARFMGLFPKGEYQDMWDKLFLAYDYFDELGRYVSRHLNFDYDEYESKRVRDFLNKRQNEAKADD